MLISHLSWQRYPFWCPISYLIASGWNDLELKAEERGGVGRRSEWHNTRKSNPKLNFLLFSFFSFFVRGWGGGRKRSQIISVVFMDLFIVYFPRLLFLMELDSQRPAKKGIKLIASVRNFEIPELGKRRRRRRIFFFFFFSKTQSGGNPEEGEEEDEEEGKEEEGMKESKKDTAGFRVELSRTAGPVCFLGDILSTHLTHAEVGIPTISTSAAVDRHQPHRPNNRTRTSTTCNVSFSFSFFFSLFFFTFQTYMYI